MKKVTLLVIAALLVSFSIASAQRWDWNKDLYNWGTETAYDLAVILDGKSPVDWTYDGYASHHFDGFSSYPIAGYTCLHWTNPNNPVEVGQMAHVGAGGPDGNLNIIDMYWTDAFGNRLPKSVVWNATSHMRFENGEATLCLTNLIEIAAVPDDEAWANPRPINVVDLRFVVLPSPVPLENLNAANTELEDMLVPLVEEALVLAPGEELQIPVPVDVAVGSFAVFSWRNLAEAVEGSDLTEARDWAQFELIASDGSLGLEENSYEPSKLLDISTFPGHSDIRYELKKAANVSVSIYSVNGERIASLVNEFSAAGQHSVSWNTQDIPSGVYICRISADGDHATSKIVHVK